MLYHPPRKETRKKERKGGLSNLPADLHSCPFTNSIFKEELKADLKQTTQKLSRKTRLKHKFFSNLYTELTPENLSKLTFQDPLNPRQVLDS